MRIRQILSNCKLKAGKWRIRYITARWVMPLVVVFSIVLAGLSANDHQILSAASVPAVGAEPDRYGSGRQTEDIERMARSNDRLANKPTIWPTSGAVTSGFGGRSSPGGIGSEVHQGIDIANNLGTPVVATADGVISRSEWSDGYGNMVQIDHGDGIATIYGHNSRLVVTVGQSVSKGQIIAYLGSTGKSTGPHVHYEVRVKGIAVDPLSFLVL